MAEEPAVRTALLGYGLAGSVFHGPLIAATPGMRLATVVTSDPTRQARARRAHPEASVVDRVADLGTLARDHDLVVVATPNRHHERLARAALGAGLAVVVDKPLAPTVAQARRLVRLARGRGGVLSVFHNRRWDAEVLTLGRLLAEGRLGTVTRVESRFERWRPEVSPGWRENPDPGGGGGVLLDLGTHLVDQALHLFGRPTHVHAEVHRRRPGATVDDDAFLALLYASGLCVHLWASLAAPAPGPRLRVVGTQGAYVAPSLDGQEGALRSGARPDSPDWGVEPPQRCGVLVDAGGTRAVEGERGRWPEYYARLVAALHGRGPLPVAAEDGVAVLEVLEAARRSSRDQRTVRVRWSPEATATR